MRLELKITGQGGTRVYFLAFGEDKGDDRSYTVTMMPLSGDAISKIPLIKELRSRLPLGLKEAKDKVDMAPSVLVENVSKEEADELARYVRAFTEVRVEGSCP